MPIDKDNPKLTQSDYKRFDFAYALDLKENYPEIWKAGGNIRGNEAFQYYAKYRNNDRSDGVLNWISEREAWAARHYKDGAQFQEDISVNESNIGGVVAQIKWGVVGVLGEAKMKATVNRLKRKMNNNLDKVFKAKAEGIELTLSGEVGSWQLNAQQIATAIEGRSNEEPLTIKINSVGGDVFEGFAIYNAIKSYKGPTTAIVEGIAASAASLFAMAADVVVCRPASLFMIHNPWVMTGGDAKDLRSAANTLDKVKEIMIERYAAKTGRGADELSEMLDAETWLTPTEAVELGFADKVEQVDEVFENTTRAILNNLTNMFQTKAKVLEGLTVEEIKNLTENLTVQDKMDLIKALADNVEGVSEVCVKMDGLEKYMDSPEVAVIPMEGHAMVLALGVLEEREVEEEVEEEEVVAEEAMYDDEEKEEAKAELNEDFVNLIESVKALTAEVNELKEERAAKIVAKNEAPTKPMSWASQVIANAKNQKSK